MNSTDFIATSTPMTEREKSDNDYHKKRYQSLWNMYEDQKKELVRSSKNQNYTAIH